MDTVLGIFRVEYLGFEVLESFLEKLRCLWRKLVPPLDNDDLVILSAYLNNWCMTPYRAARLVNFHAPKVYRRVRRLMQWRLVIPNGDEKVMMSIKGCLALFAYKRIEWDGMRSCACRAWEIECTDGLAGLLYLLGLEAEKRKLNITNITICMFEEAATHVLRYFRRILGEYLTGPESLDEVLEEHARQLGMPSSELKGALRLALYGLARLLPLSINTQGHRIVLLVSDLGIIPVVVECRKGCGKSNGLGLGCPLAAQEVREKLLSMLDKGLSIVL